MQPTSAAIYNALGYAYRALGDLDAATGYIQRALATNEALQDLTATAMFHNTLAVIAAERGHFQAAAQHVERAIRIARASGPAFNLPHFICTKAEAEIKEGKLDEAQADAEEALATANTVGNKRAAAAAKLFEASNSPSVSSRSPRRCKTWMEGASRGIAWPPRECWITHETA